MNVCLYCGTDTHNPKFCSKSHAALHNNKQRPPRTEDSKNKTSASVKISKPPYTKVSNCEQCKRWFEGRRKTCSKVCHSKLMSVKQSHRLKTDTSYRSKLGTSVSSFMEQSFATWVNQMFPSLVCIPQYAIKNEKGTGHYYLDFYFPMLNLAIELDGNQHMLAENKAHDMIRDEYLLSRGIRVVRISAREYKLQSRIDEVVSMLTNY